MSTGELLQIEPIELQFPFDLKKKKISCSLQLTNKSDGYVAFKVKTTNPKKYCVAPNTGVMIPHSTCEVVVSMQAQKESPPDMQCKDKFLLQSVVASPGLTGKDVTAEMFNKELGNRVDECKLRVVYVPPPSAPSPVQEELDEGYSPTASVSVNGTANQFPDSNLNSKGVAENNESIPEVQALVSRLTEEKQSAIRLNNKLERELEILRRQTHQSKGAPLVLLIVAGLIGILIGYLLKRG